MFLTVKLEVIKMIKLLNSIINLILTIYAVLFIHMFSRKEIAESLIE